MSMIDYEASASALKRKIKIRIDNRQSTAVLVNRLSKVRTLQIKAEMADEAARAALEK